jgi:long-subunit fatty acid transport protein
LSFTKRTELLFSHTQWLLGSGISINSFGFGQNLGKTRGVVGLTVMSLGSGEIQQTTVNQPEGTGATYSVNNLNIALSYARSFSNKIYGGITVRLMNQSISNVSATGFTLDAGIMYKTTIGKRALNEDNVHFGITLRNVGPRMTARGDGLSVKNLSPIHNNMVTQEQRSAEYELPALMNIGISYQYRFTEKHGITTAFSFTTNSFTKDQFMLGLEYNFNNNLMLRGGYTFESGVFGERDGVEAALLTAFTGPSAGLSFETPFKKEGRTRFGLDYSFRATYNFDHVHTFGIRMTL